MGVPIIKNAAENVRAACEKRLAVLYPAGVPELVMERYIEELAYFESLNSLRQSDFELFRLLSAEAKRCMQYFTLMRYTDGSSLIIYLLGESLLNPLPTHYYCEKCGYFERVKTNLPGIDLPVKACPKCEKIMRRDGFNLYSEIAFSFGKNKLLYFETHATSDFLPFARRVLERTYPNNEVVPMGRLFRLPDSEKIVMVPSGYYILPENRTIDDYPEIVSYLEDGTKCISGEWHIDPEEYDFKTVYLLHNNLLEYLNRLQQKTGIYLQDILLEDLIGTTWYDLKNTRVLGDVEHSLISQFEPKNFMEISWLIACVKNHYDGIDYSDRAKKIYGLIELIQREEFDEYPCFTREDFWETIRGLEVNNEDAFWVMEAIRKGKLTGSCDRRNMEKVYSVFDGLPENLQKTAICSKYVITRADTMSQALIYAMLAYYMKKDSKIYGRVVFREEKWPIEYKTTVIRYYP